MRRNVLSATIAALALAGALSGCAAGVAPDAVAMTASPDSTSSASAVPPSPSGSGSGSGPSSPPASAVLVFPRCEDFIPISVLQKYFSADAVAYADPGWTLEQRLPGPLARAAVTKAERASQCAWGVRGGSDGGVQAGLLELPTDVRDELITALRSSADYTEAAIDGATVFTAHVAGEIADGAVGYAFEGNTWIAVVGNSKEAAMLSGYLPAALAALHAANTR